MRRLASWLDGFMEYTDGSPSPPIFRWWAGAAAVAGALERKCHTALSDHKLYPNLFVGLIGPPASGKSKGMEPAKDLLRSIREIRIGPDDATEASLYDRLQQAMITTAVPGTVPLIHHSLSIFVTEMGTLLRPADIHICNALTSLYDCIETFDKGRRTSEDNFISDCFLNMVVCGTPSYLGSVFTPPVLEQGIPSRFILVYADKPEVRPPLFRSVEEAEVRIKKNEGLRAKLIADLDEIHKMVGQFFFTTEAAVRFQAWFTEGMPPVVNDTKFVYYNDRRHIHAAKLMMVLSAASGSDFIIDAEDFELARKKLIEVETSMPKALEFSSTNSFYVELTKIVKFVAQEFRTTRKAVPEWKIRRMISRNVPYQMIDSMLIALQTQRQLVPVGDPPDRAFRPYIKALDEDYDLYDHE